MATLEQLKRIRLILGILLLINTIATVLFITLLDSLAWVTMNFIIYVVLAVSLFVTTVKIRRILVQQMGIVPGAIPVVVMPPNQGGQPGPPPPGFATGVTGLPPTYSQPRLWASLQSGTGLGQSSAYSQSAFAQPSPVGSQPFAAFNQPGQNTYWDPSKTS